MRTLLIALLICFMSNLNAQDFHMPQASPGIELNQDFSTSYIKLKYSRPAVNGRTIFGDLIPYGEVWRTGANQATLISFGEPISINGKEIDEGSYALYTIPGEQEWKIILNADTENWGAAGYDEEKNVLETSVPVNKLEVPQESLGITLEALTKDSAELKIAWADVSVTVPLKADNQELILAHLHKELEGDKPPYAAAANYYLEINYEMEDALGYIKKAIEESPKAYYLYWTQAQIYQKLGQHNEAVASAKKSADLAKEGDPAFHYEYQRKYEKMKAQK